MRTIWKCFPNLKELSIRGGCLRNRSDFELIAQMKTVTKLSLNVGGMDCLGPLGEMTELYSLYLESNNGYILATDIVEIIKKCRKLEFLYCYHINHGDRPLESVANMFRMIKIHRDPSQQKPLQLFAYLDPPLSAENVGINRKICVRVYILIFFRECSLIRPTLSIDHGTNTPGSKNHFKCYSMILYFHDLSLI